MARYVPKTYYNRRFLRIITRTVLIVLVTFLVLFISLFFWLNSYKETGEDGTVKINVPWLMNESVSPSE